MAELFGFIKLIPNLKEWRELVSGLASTKYYLRLTATDSSRPYLIAALAMQVKKPLLVLSATADKAERLFEQLKQWSSPDNSPLLFPPYDSPEPKEQTQESMVLAQRSRILWELYNFKQNQQGKLPLIISSISAILQEVPSPAAIGSDSIKISLNNKYEMHSLLLRLQEIGYQREEIVELPGTFARRGGIIDIYSPQYQFPARLEFYGNTIENLRLFHPETQRSTETIEHYCVLPTGPTMEKGNNCLLIDYLQQGIAIINEPSEVFNFSDNECHTLSSAREGQIAEAIPGEKQGLLRYARNDTINKQEGKKEEGIPNNSIEQDATQQDIVQRLILGLPRQIHIESRLDSETNITLPFRPAPGYQGSFKSLVEQLRAGINDGSIYLIISNFAERIKELLAEENIFPNPPPPAATAIPASGLYIFSGTLDAGWSLTLKTQDRKASAVIVLGDSEIFGFSKQKRFTQKRPAKLYRYTLDLTPGDYVVHIEHGIARFKETAYLTTDGVEKEYLLLEYAEGDKLYVPTEHTDRVTKYTGGGPAPKLHRLHSMEWRRVKQRVKESALNLARELLELYATRQVIKGFAFQPDTLWQKELEASFPYMETPDQQEAIRVVKEEMEKPHPMDRLVCGDVGYGKTEVALRAAFKAVMDGKQVAVLVPTTILAEQHFNTFKQRLTSFPLHIEVLSRFKSDSEQKEITRELSSGSVDICIGTHRLLQKDVSFKDLGLLIIDEEQRFGVVHKEKLKQLSREVDVLTLSATPIPRTLHMSLLGVRDMSVIETPPEDRLPIKTTVSRYQDKLIRQAVLKELLRNGQVYFVHNRVHDIYRVRERLQGIIPEARIAIAHGQMPEEQLESIMVDFINHKTDVLLCTTIIESGLDIPNVNTLIVNTAEKLGLSQLYQLRGRVGRGINQAFAYFLYDKNRQMTPAAEKRLQTIFEASELGAGFYIAMKDLEIRGTGNILGPEQSGYIKAVGFELYNQMLQEAVAELRGETPSITPSLTLPTVNLPLPAFIPEEYISSMALRISYYRKMAATTDEQMLNDLKQELNDRFGGIPQPAEDLLYVIKTRLSCRNTGVRAIVMEDGNIVIKMGIEHRLPAELSKHIKIAGVKISGNRIRLPGHLPPDQIKEAVDHILEQVKSYGK